MKSLKNMPENLETMTWLTSGLINVSPLLTWEVSVYILHNAQWLKADLC